MLTSEALQWLLEFGNPLIPDLIGRETEAQHSLRDLFTTG